MVVAGKEVMERQRRGLRVYKRENSRCPRTASPHHIFFLPPFRVMSGPCKRAGFLCFNASSGDPLLSPLSTSHTKGRNKWFASKKDFWLERYGRHWNRETQGKKGVEAAAPTQCISWDVLMGDHGGQGALILLIKLFRSSLTSAVWSLRVLAACNNLARKGPFPYC